MKHQNRITIACQIRKHITPLPALLLCLLVFARTAAAQNVLANPPAYVATPPVLQQVQTNQMDVFQPAAPFPNVPPEAPLLQWGPVELRPHFLYRFLEGNGIQSGPSNATTTAVHTVSPGLLLAVGSHLTLDYTPTWTIYSSRQFRDSLDHNAMLLWGNAYENWIFGVSQSYVSDSPELIETAQQTKEQTYATQLSASHSLSRNTSMELNVSQTIRDVPQFTSSKEWNTLDWLDYQFWPGLSAGPGIGVGYVDVDKGADQLYEQLQGRIRWRATDKFSFEFHGGGEDRQFRTDGIDDRISPVFGALMRYVPFEMTTLTLNANRSISPSYSTNQFTESTGVTGAVTQRFFKRLYLSLEGGYLNSRYLTSAAATTAGRTRQDQSYSLSVRLSTKFLKRGTIAIFYQYSDNISNQPGYGYTSNQGGVEVGYRY
jgi:hypothetical protein